MSVATMSILLRRFPLISDEFRQEISCIENVISLSFCAYVKRPKQSSDVTCASFLVWMLSRHCSNRRENIVSMIFIDCRWILIWNYLYWKDYLIIFLCICKMSKMELTLTSPRCTTNASPSPTLTLTYSAVPPRVVPWPLAERTR
jgi:hypothetical protein